MSKGKGKSTAVIAIVVIIAVLIGIAWVLEKGLSRKGAPPGREKPCPPVATRLLIKGCLFELGVQQDQVEFYNHTVQVKPGRKFNRNQLSESFALLEKYGSVTVKDIHTVLITIDGEHWEVEFMYPKEVASVIPPPPVTPVRPTGRIAIIVDDMGVDMKPAQQLGAIAGELTFSVMPQRPHSTEVARYLHAKGHEILLHLPMQGNGGKDPGEGAIYKDMDPDHIRMVLLMDLRSVPYIAGVNNHMGSEVTPDKAIMRQVEQELKRRKLFFIDSLTTSKSVGSAVAREIGLPYNARDVFLDNEQNEAYIMGQLEQLKAIARKHGSAIGICHPHPETIAVLTREIPKLSQDGIRLERVSAFVKK